MQFHLSISAQPHRMKKSGDYYFAINLAKALRARGHTAEVFGLWQKPNTVSETSVSLQICGQNTMCPQPDMPNMLWLVSNPEYLPIHLARQYNWLGVASEDYANWLSKATGKPVDFLPQCTDTDIFTPGDGPRDGGFFFAGHSVGEGDNSLPEQLLKNEVPVDIIGRGWDRLGINNVPLKKWVNQTQLIKHYQNAKNALNRHRPAMSMFGFHNNRTYDALACGARVLSDLPIHDADLQKYVKVMRYGAPLVPTAMSILKTPSIERSEQWKIHAYLAEHYSFTARAAFLEQKAKSLLMSQEKAHNHPKLVKRAVKQARTKSSNASILFDDPALHQALDHPDAVPSDSKHLVYVAISPPQKQPPDSPKHEHQDLFIAVRRWARVFDTLEKNNHVALISLANPPENLPSHLRDTWRKAHDVTQTWTNSFIASTDHAVRQIIEAAEGRTEGAALTKAVEFIREFVLRTSIADLNRDMQTPDDDIEPYRGIDILTRFGPFLNKQALITATKALRMAEGAEKRILENPDRSAFQYFSLNRKRQTPQLGKPVAVILHAYFVDVVRHIRTHLDFLPPETAIYIATDCPQKAAAIEILLARPGQHPCIRIFENQGRDIFSKFWGFSDVYADHDVVLHLHTKRSTHNDQLRGWMDHTLKALIPDSETINFVLSLFRNIGSLGVLGRKPFEPLVDGLDWRLNKPLCQELARRMNMPLPNLRALEFPGGSMFWARSAALKPLLDLDLTQSDFPPEAGQVDATLGHAVERLIFHAAQHIGFKTAQIGSDLPKSRFCTGIPIQDARAFRANLSGRNQERAANF